MKMVCKSNCVNTYPLIVGKVYDSVPLPLMTRARAKDVFKFGKAIAETFVTMDEDGVICFYNKGLFMSIDEWREKRLNELSL